MLVKSAIFLLFAGACLAFPADEKEAIPNGPISAPIPPQPLPPQPIAVGPEEPLPEGAIPQGQIPPGAEGVKPENSDLKTDSSIWYYRYPVYHSRSYHSYPRSYTYSYYPTFYSYWRPSYWW